MWKCDRCLPSLLLLLDFKSIYTYIYICRMYVWYCTMDNENLALCFPSNFLVLIIASQFLLKSIFNYYVIITMYIQFTTESCDIFWLYFVSYTKSCFLWSNIDPLFFFSISLVCICISVSIAEMDSCHIIWLSFLSK